jgi:hypothetical protein
LCSPTNTAAPSLSKELNPAGWHHPQENLARPRSQAKGIGMKNIVVLYRYPHPFIDGKWIHVGQGSKRDQHHRGGRTSFGRRFKAQFPDVPLPQPVIWWEPIANQIEANEAETIAMFQFRTWHGYEGGMNLTVPGCADYTALARNQPREAKVRGGRIGGRIAGRRNVESGHLAKLRTPEHQRQAARMAGRRNVESGHLRSISSLGARSQPRESKVFGGQVTQMKRKIKRAIAALEAA